MKKASLPVVTGSMPAEAQAISTPIVADQALFELFDKYLSTLPDGYSMLKADKSAEALAADPAPFLIDVRSAEEWKNEGYIKGAVNIPLPEFFASLDKLPAKDAPIFVYCGSGHRGAMAMMGLQMMGWTKVTNIGGGLNGWKAANLPVEGWVNWTAVWGEFFKSMPETLYVIKSDALARELGGDAVPFLVDVRDPAEVEKDGYIKGSVHLPIRNLLKNLDKLPAQDAKIVIYCGSGHRGAMGMAALRLLGYTDVHNLAGGIGAWKKAELPVDAGLPAEAAAGVAPTVDPTRFAALDMFLSTLPDGFYGIKAADFKAELDAAKPQTVIDLRTTDNLAHRHDHRLGRHRNPRSVRPAPRR